MKKIATQIQVFKMLAKDLQILYKSLVDTCLQ